MNDRMIDTDTGNATTQKMYELATQPIFVDRSQDVEQEVSWEIAGEQDAEQLPHTQEEIKEEIVPHEEEQEISEEKQSSTEPEIEEESEEVEKKKKKNRTSEKNRIAQLTRELRQAQSVAHDVLTRNQYLESKISQKEKESFATQENYLNSQKERVKKYLTDAIEEGDPSKIAEANDLLSQYNTEILLLNKQKQSFQTELPQQKSYTQPSYQEPVDTPYQETGKEWMDKNSWANPNSPNFDQEMYEAADNYSIRLARKYKLEGRADEVGTTDFFDEITDYIKHSYDISTPPPSKPQSRDRMQMKTDQSPPVGAVTRQAPVSQGTPKPRDIVLTPEQKEIAYSLRGFVRDPKTGQKIQDNRTLEEIYKRNLMKGNG
jgi:hypothetical protein